MFKKFYIFISLFLLIIFIFIPVSFANKEINWITHQTIFQATGEGELLEEFEKQTGIKVNVFAYGVDVLQEKVMTEIMSQSGQFDVISLGQSTYRSDLGEGIFKNLEPMFGEIVEFEDFSTGLLEIFRGDDGGLYGLPVRSGCTATLYRSDLFEENGLSDPQEDPYTIDEFLDSTIKLTKDLNGDGLNDIYGYSFFGKQGSQQVDVLETWLPSFGTQIFDQEKKEILINSQEAIDAAQLLVDLVNKHQVCPPGVLSYTSAEEKTLMQEGKVAQTTSCWWQYIGYYDDPSQSKVVGKVKIGYLPKDPNKGYGYGQGGAWALFINENSNNKEEAWEFIKFLTNKENQLYGLLHANGPTRMSIFKTPEFTKMAGIKGAKIISEIYEKIRVPKPIPNWLEVREVITQEFSLALVLEKTVKDAFDSAAEEISSLLGY